MKKQLMVGLFSAGLLVAMLPGLTVAKDDGKSACMKGDWTEWVREDGSAFADQGECVAYVAKGGTLKDPSAVSTFQSVCLSRGGTNLESYTYAGFSPVCEWWVPITDADHSAAGNELATFCVAGGEGVWGGGIIDPDNPSGWWGCYS